eukprot:CAMPEP_0194751642 /NCGR_PEP_ID=MMETSP0323_2-20130528/5636_1 /TAXON_ID=2866 ORGANISM="Crypthecodinium cohnii, Strain Seligo" /NCGR_SAMPLE_ID=MMETSP0323_2 /ASSEMBLY_ACC=CAM_ASM_000346 /LENGTH=122 /DNA_ID=CAMNT_0039668217 /DNA_START=473 /DNA_END=838 /DNA_ORIENTATION=+
MSRGSSRWQERLRNRLEGKLRDSRDLNQGNLELKSPSHHESGGGGLDLGVDRAVLDATLTHRRQATFDADEALLSPSSAPRVLDLPIVLAAVGAVADDQDAVVQPCATTGGDHATLVELEDL